MDRETPHVGHVPVWVVDDDRPSPGIASVVELVGQVAAGNEGEPAGGAGNGVALRIMEGEGRAVQGVWKYKCGAKLEHPALLQASTFQTYCLPALRWLVVKLVVAMMESSTKMPLATSFTATS